jgi:hypothetical protein
LATCSSSTAPVDVTRRSPWSSTSKTEPGTRDMGPAALQGRRRELQSAVGRCPCPTRSQNVHKNATWRGRDSSITKAVPLLRAQRVAELYNAALCRSFCQEYDAVSYLSASLSLSALLQALTTETAYSGALQAACCFPCPEGSVQHSKGITAR